MADPGGRSRSTRWLIAALVPVSGLLVVAGIALCAANWMRGQPWDLDDLILVTVRWSGVLMGLGVGLWWWWRAPNNPTGQLLLLAALADCIYLIGYNWPNSRWVGELCWADSLVLPCLALLVLGWPTGRPTPLARRAVIVLGVSDVLLVLVGDVFSRLPAAPTRWPNPPEALFTVPSVWHLVDPLQALGLQAIPAVVTIVVLVRRRRAVPPAVRSLITPITVAGVLVAGALVLLHVGFQLFGSLLSTGSRLSTWQLVPLLGNYSDVAVVAVGVLLAANRRRRAVAMGSRRLEVDLHAAPAVVRPSAAAAATVGDPTARVLYPRPNGAWIDSSGRAVELAGPGRRLLPAVDDTGVVTAALEVAASAPLPPLLADLAVSVITARAANERATALADARREEVRNRSRDLVDATDAGRWQLERNLHDGAQQLLVGLALSAGLAVRGGTTYETAAVIDHVHQVRVEILALIDSTVPAQLSRGLAAALRSLSAVCPITTVFEAVGDLAADDRLALDLYLAAGEAIANAMKHSDAATITVGLAVAAGDVRLQVHDDGVGEVTKVPPAIASRVANISGHIELTSPTGGGTMLSICVQRELAGAPA